MVRVLAFVPQVLLIALAGYTLAVAAAGWRNPPPPNPGTRRRRLIVVVPAHDEEAVIAAVVRDVLESDYPLDQFHVWVVADRCSDATAQVARTAGASVMQRAEGPEGKGAALAWFLDRSPIEAGTGLVVLDADNRVPPGLLARFADEMDDGASAIQAYLDTARPDESMVSLASALSYWASNRMVQLARHNLGWPVVLGGTGMCLEASALTIVGGFGHSLVEDQDLAVRMALAGIGVRWLHDERVHDEKPAEVAVALRQRARWAAGRRKVAREHLGPLVKEAWRRRRWGLADLALRLVQPSRAAVALSTAILAVVAAWSGSEFLLAWWLWAVAAAIQFVAPVPFLVRDGIPTRRVVAYPLLALFAVLWLPVQVASRRATGWSRTPHRGDGTPSGEEPPEEA